MSSPSHILRLGSRPYYSTGLGQLLKARWILYPQKTPFVLHVLIRAPFIVLQI